MGLATTGLGVMGGVYPVSNRFHANPHVGQAIGASIGAHVALMHDLMR